MERAAKRRFERAQLESRALNLGDFPSYWPLPVRLKVLDPVDVLSVRVSVEFSAPLIVGVKTTVATHVAPAARVLGLRGHVSVSV